MIKLKEKVNSVIRSTSIVIDLSGTRNIYYTINDGEDNMVDIHVKLPEYCRPTKSEEIVDDSNEFVFGFKVVQMSNGEYAYVRESDNTLLPFRYDVAFDFNEYGFAIVCKDGSVSWIDKSFRYLNLKGEMVEENPESLREFKGWQGVSSFSKGDIPLSRVYDGRFHQARIAYFKTDGKLAKFYQYDGEITDHYKNIFEFGTVFDENGYAKADNKVLLARGYFVTYDDLVKLSMEKGLIDSISKDIEKTLVKRRTV